MKEEEEDRILEVIAERGEQRQKKRRGQNSENIIFVLSIQLFKKISYMNLVSFSYIEIAGMTNIHKNIRSDYVNMSHHFLREINSTAIDRCFYNLNLKELLVAYPN